MSFQYSMKFILSFITVFIVFFEHPGVEASFEQLYKTFIDIINREGPNASKVHFSGLSDTRASQWCKADDAIILPITVDKTAIHDTLTIVFDKSGINETLTTMIEKIEPIKIGAVRCIPYQFIEENNNISFPDQRFYVLPHSHHLSFFNPLDFSNEDTTSWSTEEIEIYDILEY